MLTSWYMNYVIGDIHAEISKLRRLTEFIHKKDATPCFIFIGDYIDKGEDAKATLDFLLEAKHNHTCVFLLGNHEYAWQHADEYEAYLLKYGALNTIQSMGGLGIRDTRELLFGQYREIFDSLVSYYIVGNYFICHSGIDPDVYENRDAESRLPKEFLFNRYDFIRQSRLFLDRYTVIFGHTGFYRPYYDGYKIGIDTAACYLPTQPVTAFCLEESSFLNSDGEAFDLDDITDRYCPNILRNKPWRTI
jgi:serine/threonine protein phosphatase 1